MLNGSQFTNLSFVDCLFKKDQTYSDNYNFYDYQEAYVDSIQYQQRNEFYKELKEYNIKAEYADYVQVIKGVEWSSVYLHNMSPNAVLIFEKCTFSDFKIEVSDDKYLIFSDCTFKGQCEIRSTGEFAGSSWLYESESRLEFPLNIGRLEEPSDDKFLRSMNKFFRLLELNQDIQNMAYNLESAVDQLARTQYLFALVELYILTNEHKFLKMADNVLNRELAESQFTGQTNNTGMRRLLVVMLHIMRDDDLELAPEVLEHAPDSVSDYVKDLGAWRQWLGNNKESLKEQWDWQIWDEHVQDIVLNDNQKVTFQYMKTSAQGNRLPSMKKFKEYLK